MKKIIFGILLLSSTHFITLGQNLIYFGDNSYKSTSTWPFEMNGSILPTRDELKVTVARHSNGGYLMLSTHVPFKSYYIGGTVTVFTSNGVAIKCTDKGIRDHVNGESVALYNFTSSEIEMIKSNRITRIRFSIMGGFDGLESFTADNRGRNFGIDRPREEFKTELEVWELFE